MSNFNGSSPLPDVERPTTDSEAIARRALAALRKKGNPFRQQFARNSDDAYCTIFHVSELFADERAIPRALVESYRGQPNRPTAVLPLLGARGSGKTHLLHWLKHDVKSPPQLFVTPGTFRIDAAGQDAGFLEYLLFQLVNVLLAGGEQRGCRPLDFIGDRLTRRILADLLPILSVDDRLQLLTIGGMRRGLWKFGIGVKSAAAAFDAVRENLKLPDRSCRELIEAAHIDPHGLLTAAVDALERSESRDLKGEYRKRILAGIAEAALLGNAGPLADFLTDGFADVAFLARPTRTHMTLTLLQALTELIVGSGIPIAVAFDQLEELLYGQTEEEIRRSSDGFFGGLVQLMSQAPGLCVLLLVEEGLWNRIVPQLSPHILDRIHEPLHIPERGDLRNVRLRAPTLTELVEVVACRVRRTLSGFDGLDRLPAEFPFELEFLERLARRETVLRLMLQGCCSRLDEIFEKGMAAPSTAGSSADSKKAALIDELAEETVAADDWRARWFQEVRSAERKLKPVGSLAGATIELAGGLTRVCELLAESGKQCNDRRLGANPERISVGSHPTYGVLTVLIWQGERDESPYRVGVGLWLGRGVGKPRDLETKLEVFACQPPLVDRLILFRPDDDARLSGRTQQIWSKAIEENREIRTEAAPLELFAKLYAFPRWLQQAREQAPDGVLADEARAFIDEQFAKTIELVAPIAMTTQCAEPRIAA